MEKDHKAVDTAKRGDAVAMKIEVCREGGWYLGGCSVIFQGIGFVLQGWCC